MTRKLTIIICVCFRYSPACCGSAASEAPSSPAPSCVAELWVSIEQHSVLHNTALSNTHGALLCSCLLPLRAGDSRHGPGAARVHLQEAAPGKSNCLTGVVCSSVVVDAELKAAFVLVQSSFTMASISVSPGAPVPRVCGYIREPPVLIRGASGAARVTQVASHLRGGFILS